MSLFRANRWFASAALSIGVISSLAAFRAIERAEEPRHLVLDNLVVGEHHYYVQAGEQCVGEFTTKLGFSASVSAIRVEGKLLVRTRERTATMTLSGEGFFNPLGQLSQGRIVLSSDELDIVTQFRDVHPIMTDFHATIGTFTIDKSLSFPGPALLVTRPSERYGVSYPSFTTSALPLLPLAQRIGPLPAITITPANTPCTLSPLSVTALQNFSLEDLL